MQSYEKSNKMHLTVVNVEYHAVLQVTFLRHLVHMTFTLMTLQLQTIHSSRIAQ